MPSAPALAALHLGGAEAIAPSRRAAIVAALADIEATHGVRILYACESGSRGWGFSSPDSDYDVRFIYVHPLPWYVQVSPQRDVIEVPIADDFDLSGWELRKALGLVKRGNPTVAEWLSSPIVYRADAAAVDALRAAAATGGASERARRHYLHLAAHMRERHCSGSRVRIKKLFYVLRPLLAAMWIEQGRGAPPMLFETLASATVTEPALRAAVADLVASKRLAREADLAVPPAHIMAFVDRELSRLLAVRRPQAAIDGPALDRLLLDTVRASPG